MPVASSSPQSKANTFMSSHGGTSKSNMTTSTHSGNSQPDTSLSPPVVSSGGQGAASSARLFAAPSDVVMESVDTPLRRQETLDGLSKNLDLTSGKPEDKNNMGAVQEEQESNQGATMTALKSEGDPFIFNSLFTLHKTSCIFKLGLKTVFQLLISQMRLCVFINIKLRTVLLDGAEKVEKSEVQAIIESTPELDMDFDGCRGTRYVTL